MFEMTDARELLRERRKRGTWLASSQHSANPTSLDSRFQPVNIDVIFRTRAIQTAGRPCMSWRDLSWCIELKLVKEGIYIPAYERQKIENNGAREQESNRPTSEGEEPRKVSGKGRSDGTRCDRKQFVPARIRVGRSPSLFSPVLHLHTPLQRKPMSMPFYQTAFSHKQHLPLR